MPRANRHFLPGYVWHISHLNSSQFQLFQWFDRLTMSGLILNRFAPFKPHGSSKFNESLTTPRYRFSITLCSERAYNGDFLFC